MQESGYIYIYCPLNDDCNGTWYMGLGKPCFGLFTKKGEQDIYIEEE